MKWVVRVTAGLCGLLILSIVGMAYFPASPFKPAPRESPDESQFKLDEKVGWYQFEDGSLRLLTWADERGLVLYRFGSAREDLSRLAFHPLASDVLVSSTKPDERRLEFFRDEDGKISEARMTTPAGVQSMIPVTGPYQIREVRFGGEEIRLAGLLFVPSDPGPHPAVAFIHGSGTSSRDAFWYLTPADSLARQGIAVLLPDKRGSGKSGGEWHTSSFDQFAKDALAAVDFLAGVTTIDAGRIGLAGFSQGGWIAPLAASRSPGVAFVITVSGSAATPSEQLVYEVTREISNAGAPRFLARAIAPLFARRAKMPKKQWWELNGSFDPIPYWQDLQRPSLLILGEEDQNVDVSRSLARLEAADLATRESFSIKLFPGLGHGLIREDTGWLEPEYLTTMGQFILTKEVGTGPEAHENR